MPVKSNQKRSKNSEACLSSEDRDEIDNFFLNRSDLATTTARTYSASWWDFLTWCTSNGREALPTNSAAVADYLDDRRHFSLSTIRNRLSAISFVHGRLGLGDPTNKKDAAKARKTITQEKREEETHSPAERLKDYSYSPSEIINDGLPVLKNYLKNLQEKDANEIAAESTLRYDRWKSWQERREQAQDTWLDPLVSKEKASVDAITTKQRELIPKPEFSLSVMRDRAILLLMTAAGASRPEMARMDLVDVILADGRLLLGVRRKNGMPDRTVEISASNSVQLCPVRAVTAWIVGAGIAGGPLFRSFDAHGNIKPSRIALSPVNLIVRNAAEMASLNPQEWTPSRLQREP